MSMHILCLVSCQKKKTIPISAPWPCNSQNSIPGIATQVLSQNQNCNWLKWLRLPSFQMLAEFGIFWTSKEGKTNGDGLSPVDEANAGLLTWIKVWHGLFPAYGNHQTVCISARGRSWGITWIYITAKKQRTNGSCCFPSLDRVRE